MIVDDNEINISTLADFLSTQNLKIASVKSGVDFLTQISNVQPDIVLMDIQMPGMDGLETTRRLRLLSDHRLASVPVVAVTALAMPGDRERCIEAGADEYVTKPFRLLEIQDLILKMVEERKPSIGR
jgi:CheY-like chemotaxis protein